MILTTFFIFDYSLKNSKDCKMKTMIFCILITSDNVTLNKLATFKENKMS